MSDEMSMAERTRQRNKQSRGGGRRMLGQMIGVVGGGVMGIGIAVVILTKLNVPVPYFNENPEQGETVVQNSPRGNDSGRNLGDLLEDKARDTQPRFDPDRFKKEEAESGFPQPEFTDEPTPAKPLTSVLMPGQTISTAEELTNALTAADGATRSEEAPITPEVYKKLCQLGQDLAWSNKSDDTVNQLTGAINETCSRLHTADRLTKLGQLSAIWLDSPNRDSQGIALAGVLVNSGKSGPYFRYDFQLVDGSQVVSVVTTNYFKKLNENAVAVVIGSIVDPATKLTDFEGDQERVVFLGYMYWVN